MCCCRLHIAGTNERQSKVTYRLWIRDFRAPGQDEKGIERWRVAPPRHPVEKTSELHNSFPTAVSMVARVYTLYNLYLSIVYEYKVIKNLYIS